MLDGLDEDHRSWLLVAAHNFIHQQRPERAIVLLELLDAVDPENAQCQKMLAYAFWLADEPQRCAAVLERIGRLPLSANDQAAMAQLARRLDGD